MSRNLSFRDSPRFHLPVRIQSFLTPQQMNSDWRPVSKFTSLNMSWMKSHKEYDSTELHCASVLRTTFAPLARARARAHQAKLDREINVRAKSPAGAVHKFPIRILFGSIIVMAT